MPLSVSSRLCAALLVSVAATLPIESAFAQEKSGEYRQLVPGLLSRSVFKGTAGNSSVEIFDWLVGARKTSEEIITTDRAMLDVQAGDATLVVDGKPQPVRPGAVIPLDRNQRITVDNSGGERPFVARMILVSPAQR